MADIAIFRINYKSDFILTLQSDAGWLTPFCIKFWTGAPSQAYFAGYDGTTYTHCAPVDGDHTKLSVQFDDHHLPIGDLKFQIGYHFTVADFPTSIEDEVINQAAVIIDNDGEQQQVMLDFNGETAPDIAFSLPAYANEAQRIANEQVRIASEEQRVSNEQQRISNEEGRISAEERRQEHEQQRIHNEETRIAEFARLEADAIAATGAANDAATIANEKAQLASDKAALAQSAATLASDKAQLAADKAALAQAAATLANDKAALAQQKADYAQAKGDYAQAQGDYAKAQGDIALADHERAETDHERAEADHDTATDDHTTATSDHTQAESDHTRAEADHTTAASDHTQASSDHDRAESDHTKAGQDHDRAESDHTTAAADHTRAESDHAAVEVYVDSLGAFDISAYHATGSVLAKYADLTAALGTNGANIPDALRKGGMSVKFVLSSDNNYMQYRCIADEFTTDESKWAICDSGVYIGNPDWIRAITDNEDKIIGGVKPDGSIEWFVGVPTPVKEYVEGRISDIMAGSASTDIDGITKIINFLDGLTTDDNLKQILEDIEERTPDLEGNPEYIDAMTDQEGKVIEGHKYDGTKVINTDLEIPAATIAHVPHNEWINAEIDGEGNVLSGTKFDGSHYSHELHSETIDRKVEKEEGKGLVDKDVADMISSVENHDYLEVELDENDNILGGRDCNGVKFENIGLENPAARVTAILDRDDRIEVKTDLKDNIISFRDKDGVLNENAGIRTNSLELSSEGMSEFQQALIDSGFKPGGAGDWSQKSVIYLALPDDNLPVVNITCDTIPTLKTDSYNAVMEYYDGNGNYFKKNIKKFGCQGRTTMAYPKKNFKWDFSDCKIKFGKWVMQDSFQLKANYLDIIRGKSNIAYDYFLDIISYNKEIQDIKPWIKTNISDYDAYGGKKNDSLDFTTDARGVPAGFAVRLFMNGSFYGIYTFNLKKHRDNYAMNKSKAKHIHIDPDSMNSILAGHTPVWEDFELRNPKDLVDVDGNEYDGDDPKELTGDPEVDALSAQVKQYILDFSAANGRLYANNVTPEDYEAVYNVDWNIDFTIFQNVILDGDGIGSNTQYCTWDGVIWYPMPYDLDQIFGNQSKGNFIARVTRDHLSKIVGIDISPVAYTRKLYDFYKARIDARYKELRDSGIISVPYLMGKIKQYIDNLGSAAMKEELTKWPETPCYRSPNTNSQWLFLGQNYTDHQATVYDDGVTYHVGDVVTWGYMDYPYQCLEECTGVPPMSEYYNEEPRAGGFYDSIERMEIWLKERISFIDTYYNYNQN